MSARLQSSGEKWLARAMQVEDLERVLQIEKQSYQFPWGEAVFRDCLRMQYVCRVLEDEECDIHGYGLMSTGAGEGHILNLCVDGAQQRSGMGRFLLARLMEDAVSQRLNTVFLEVRPSNLAAIALYESSGFSRIGLRRNYYPARDGREDAILLARMLD